MTKETGAAQRPVFYDMTSRSTKKGRACTSPFLKGLGDKGKVTLGALSEATTSFSASVYSVGEELRPDVLKGFGDMGKGELHHESRIA